jgi:pyrroloquinoline quinone (PQQ) biosynthesis protein C
MDRKAELLRQYDLFPFHHHPLWLAIQRGDLSFEQVIQAEVQHCIRTRAGRPLREQAMQSAKGLNEKLFTHLMETYLEECTNNDQTGPSHLELIERLVMIGGTTHEEIYATQPTPGNSAAIALYTDIAHRGAGCHMLGAGAVEHYYCKLSPKIFDAYVDKYRMSETQAWTYKLHGPMDEVHADRAFAVLDEVIELHGWSIVLQSVRDAFVATSLHYDGMLQAATKSHIYWDGKI